MSESSDARSRVRNAAAMTCDAMKRLDRAEKQMAAAVAAGREEGLTENDLAGAIHTACAGRPDRARALEALTARWREEAA